MEAVLANIVRAASASLGYQQVLLSVHDRADGVLVPRAHVGLSDQWPKLEPLRLPSERIAGTAAGADGPAPLASLLPRSTHGEVVSVALVAGEQLVGLLELAGPDGNAVTEDDRVVLELFASQAVNAIRLARAHETTRLGSLRDPLTGVANHGHFQETLYREVTRHERSGERLVLLMVDLDDFKAVNDRYGHPAGDTVLKAVVARLLTSVREMDTVSRYGGEEFTIILPQTDATQRASRRRTAPGRGRRLAPSGRAPRAASAHRFDRPRRLPRRRALEGRPRRVRRQGPLRREEDREEPGREVHEGAATTEALLTGRS